MVHQIQKNQLALLLLILVVLIVLSIIAINIAGQDSGLAVSKAVESGVSPIYGTFEHNIRPWGIDAERMRPFFFRF